MCWFPLIQSGRKRSIVRLVSCPWTRHNVLSQGLNVESSALASKVSVRRNSEVVYYASFFVTHIHCSRNYWAKTRHARILKYSDSKYIWNIIFEFRLQLFPNWTWMCQVCILEHSSIFQVHLSYCVCRCLNASWIFYLTSNSERASAWILLSTWAVHRNHRAP